MIIDSRLDPVVLRVAREVFDAEQDLRRAAPTPASSAATRSSASPSTQLHPVVSRDSVAWLDVSGEGDIFGYAASTKLGGASPVQGRRVRRRRGRLRRRRPGHLRPQRPGHAVRRRRLRQRPSATVPFEPALAAGLAGSDAGAAWAGGGGDVVLRRPGRPGHHRPASTASRATPITGLGTGGGMVGIGTDGGQVFAWQPGGQAQRRSASSTAR